MITKLGVFSLDDLYILTPREATVTILRHGLDGGPERELSDISALTGLSTIQISRSLRRGEKRLLGILMSKGTDDTVRIVKEAGEMAEKRKKLEAERPVRPFETP